MGNSINRWACCIAYAMAVWLSVSMPVQAQLRHYTPSWDQATWSVAPDHPLRCELSQTIPNYGLAVFAQRAGEPPYFELQAFLSAHYVFFTI